MARNYKRDRKGRFARVNSLKSLPSGQKVSSGAGRGAASVPYARVSTRSVTGGWNGGVNLSKNYRLSVGGYARIQKRGKTDLQKKFEAVSAREDALISKVAGKITQDERLKPRIEAAARRARTKLVNKAIGGQYNLPGGKATGRLTTSQNGLPTVTIRKGRSRVSRSARGAAMADYNEAMRTSLKGNKVKTPRPQRRKAA